MNKIEELINQLCPEGVEFKELDEIALFRRGSFPQPYGNDEWYNGEDAMPFVQVCDVTNKMLLVNETKKKISKLAQPKSIFVPKGTVIVTLQGTIGRVAITQYDSYVDRTLAIFETFKIEVNKKYFAYQLKAKFDIEKDGARGSTIKTITKAEFKNFQIPIPPLPIQEEIVAILDKFTRLEAELEAELEARKTQYEHYRDELLSFENGVEVKSISEICHINRGRVMSKDYLRDNAGSYPVYSSQTANKGVFGLINTYDYDFESVTWTTDGANAGSIFYHNNEKFSITNVCGLLKIKDDISILTKFLYYVLGFTTKIYVSEGMGNPKLMSNAMSRIQIPIPPLPIQEEIVAILDKFDALVNDISVGLPAEIEARRKQYEYYRNKLLTFKEVK